MSGTGSRVSRALLLAGTILSALFLSVLTASLFRLEQAPGVLALTVLGVGVYAAVRPHSALVLVAAVLPITTYLLRRWAYGIAWPEAVVIAFAAGWIWRGALGRSDPPLPKTLQLPVLAFASVLLTSLLVQMMVDESRLGSAAFTSSILRHVSREYFANGTGRYLQAGELLLEGLFLFCVSARAVAVDGRLARRLAGALAASTALAAAVNLQQIVKSAQRFPDFWHVLEQSLVRARFNVQYADVNAAGSVFALLLLVAGGLAAARGRLWRFWTAAAVFLALGLWMSGSRTALLACPVALAALGLVAARTHMSRRGRTLVAAGAVTLLCAAIAVVYAPTRGNQKASSIAAQVRVEMARTTMRMVAQAPVFGIGLGEFYQRSGEFSSPELLALFPPAQHENAHNNFLQILAETGLIGLATFIVILMAALYSASRPLWLRPADTLAWGCVAGLAAFLLTCAGGHPLLTREAAYSFWLVLGLAAGHSLDSSSPRPANERHSRSLATAATIVVVCLAVSVPFRAASARAHGEFEHLAIGVSSLWETAPDGVRYRSAVTSASIFVPGETGYRFRVRALSKTPERLELRLGSRVADIIELAPDRWTDIAMRPRNDRADVKFTKLDLQIVGDDRRPVTIWITKVEPLER